MTSGATSARASLPASIGAAGRQFRHRGGGEARPITRPTLDAVMEDVRRPGHYLPVVYERGPKGSQIGRRWEPVGLLTQLLPVPCLDPLAPRPGKLRACVNAEGDLAQVELRQAFGQTQNLTGA